MAETLKKTKTKIMLTEVTSTQKSKHVCTLSYDGPNFEYLILVCSIQSS